MLNIKEIALKVADSLRNKIDGISHMQSNQGLVAFAEALISAYKAELLKEVGEPVTFLHQWIEYHPYGDTVAGEPCSAITNDGKPFDKSDTVTPLYASDQLAAGRPCNSPPGCNGSNCLECGEEIASVKGGSE